MRKEDLSTIWLMNDRCLKTSADSSEITIATTGDSILNRRMSIHDDPPFLALIKLLRDADVAYTNLETIIHNYEDYPSAHSGGTWMRSPHYIVDELKWAGFDMVSCANNHVMDYSYGGMLSTMKKLDEGGIVNAGVGKNLGEAREPKYLETSKGRMAIISACSSFNDWNRAGNARPDLQGRPGLNPLRVNFVVDRETFEGLQKLLSKFNLWVERVDDELQFFSPAPVYLLYKLMIGDKPGVYPVSDKSDFEGNIKSVREAKRQSDYALVALHCDECDGERETPATFIPTFARACIDAGADLFVGHGPHVLRGIEIYKGKPIFYSLGNFCFESDTTSKLPADFYERYKLGSEATPADAFDARARRKIIPPWGRPDVASERFFESVVSVCTYRDSKLTSVKLYPIDLGLDKPRSQRGRPVLAEDSLAEEIVERLAKLSSHFGTKILYDEGIGKIVL